MKAKISKREINSTVQDYNIDGMYKPIFYNLGTSVVTIMDVELQPKESFSADFQPYVSEGNIPIVFKEFTQTNRAPADVTKTLNRVVVVFGTLKEDNCPI